jgi:hypothetical protein
MSAEEERKYLMLVVRAHAKARVASGAHATMRARLAGEAEAVIPYAPAAVRTQRRHAIRGLTKRRRFNSRSSMILNSAGDEPASCARMRDAP